MNINHLEYFMAACDTGSLSEASKRVFVSQQSMSAAVAALERELNTTLLIRSRAGVAPTPEGAVVYRAARQILDTINSMRDELANARAHIEGPLTIAYIPEVFLSCGYSFEERTLDAFRDLWPDVRLECYKGQSDFCEKTVKQGIVDLAIVSGVNDTASFRVIPLWESEVLLYVRSDHPLASRPSVSFTELEGQELLAPPGSGYPLWEIVRLCQRYGFTPRIVPTNDKPGGPRFNQPGEGQVGFVLAGFSLNHIDDSYVTVPFVERDRVTIPANAIVRTGTALSAQSEVLVEHLRLAFNGLTDGGSH